MAKTPQNKSHLFKYVGLATTFFVGIAITLWIGMHVDDFFNMEFPLLVWLLPLLLIAIYLYRIIKETTSK